MIELEGIKYFEVKDLAEQLDKSRATIKRWIQKYNCKYKAIGKDWYISEIEVKKLLEA